MLDIGLGVVLPLSKEKFDFFSVKITRFGTCFSVYKNFTHLTGDIHPCPIPSGYTSDRQTAQRDRPIAQGRR